MITRMVMIKRKAGMSLEEFRDYYETHHATLALRLFPMFASYKRCYIQANPPRLPEGAAESPYDVVSEIGFASEADHQAFLAKIARPEVVAEIRADEAKFSDLSRTFSFLASVAVSPIKK